MTYLSARAGCREEQGELDGLAPLLRDLRSSRTGRSCGHGRDRVPGYRIVTLISQGGMGGVYRAIQRSMDRPVALKILHPRLSDDAEFVARFRQEAHLGAILQHPNLVRVYDAGEVAGLHYYSMEMSESCDLGVFLRLRGRLPERFGVRVALEVAKALEVVHAAQVVHRDVKPDNILVTRDGGIKLVDLGLAQWLDPSKGGVVDEGTILGTPNYMSPEQIAGLGESTARSDVYGLGVTLLHLVSGELPFGLGPATEVFARVVRGAQTIPETLEPGLRAIIARCMHWNPAKRYANASVLREVLRGQLRAGTRAARRGRLWPPTRRSAPLFPHVPLRDDELRLSTCRAIAGVAAAVPRKAS